MKGSKVICQKGPCLQNQWSDSIKHPKRQKITSPWLVIPPLNEDETEDTMKEKTQQLRKICRLPRTDQAMVKTLMLATYPVRCRMIIDATECRKSPKTIPSLVATNSCK